MNKSRSLAFPVLALGCLLLFACKSAGTPKESDGGAGRSQAAIGPQAQARAVPVSQNRGAGYPVHARSAPAAQPADPAAGPVRRTEILPAVGAEGRAIEPMAALAYGAVPVVIVALVGGLTTAFAGRPRRTTPALSTAGRLRPSRVTVKTTESRSAA